MSEMLQKYKAYKEDLKNYGYALFIMGFDESTDCPKDGKEYSLEVQQYFQSKMLDINLSKDYQDTLFYLRNHKEELNEIEAQSIEKECKELDKLNKIPKEVMLQHMKNLSRSSLEWAKARETLDYSKFEVELKELIEYNKNYIKYLEDDKLKGFNVILNDMEDDFTTDMYDEFFNLVEVEIIPLVQQILKLPKKYNPKLLELKFPISKQKELTNKIADLMGYTTNVGCIRETIHPFTSGAHNKDVRITTKYQEDQLLSNLYSIMHEVGHALYELQNADELNNTNLSGGASCALHESQSRFYENYIGRSKEFIDKLYPILIDIFPTELEGITKEDIYYYCNSVESQTIRIEADELTYPIHVLIRYKIEKMIFNNEIEVEDIDKLFNDLMEEYLLIRPTNKKEGCFQDSHWSGFFGYFPTYALGSAMSAQILNAMRKDLDFEQTVSNLDFKTINTWLKEHIHKYGSSKKNLEVLKIATGEDFDPKYYIDYLKNKFKNIYEL